MFMCIVNGEAYQADKEHSLLELLQALNLVGRKVAIERNGEIVPKNRHETTLLMQGDIIEIVTAVGGG